MDNEALLCELLINKTKEVTKNNKSKFIHDVAVWISRVFIEETKVTVDHSDDPPWDSSGYTRNTQLKFNPSDYTTLDSFTEFEYNGQSNPSFMSGCGIFHKQYHEDLEEIADNFSTEMLTFAVEELYQRHKETFDTFIQRVNSFEKVKSTSDICLLITSEDIIGEFIVCELPRTLMEEVNQIDLAFLITKGRDEALKEIKEERIAQEKRYQEEKKEKEKGRILADKISEELEARHRLKYGIPTPKRIELGYYKTHIINLLEDITRDGVTSEDIRNAARYFSFQTSNSVGYMLLSYLSKV